MPHFGEPRTYPELADYLIYQENSRFKARSGWTSHVDYRSDEMAEVIEDVINSVEGEGSGRGLHAHIKTPPSGVIHYLITRKIVTEAPFRLTGAGNNRVILYLADDVDDDMFQLSPTAVDYIVEFENIKMYGNLANNTAGTAVVNDGAHEFSMCFCEIRDFKNFNIEFNAAYQYNKLIGNFFLQQRVQLNKCDDFLITNNHFTVGGRIAIATADVYNVVIANNTFTTLSRVSVSGGDGIIIHNNRFIDIGGGAVDAIRFWDTGAAQDGFSSVKNNLIVGNGARYGIRVDDGWDYVDVQENDVWGNFGTAAVSFGAVGAHCRENNNEGNVGKYQEQADAAWVIPTGNPLNGTRVLVYNSHINQVAAPYRIYTYLNGAWRYVTLT